MVLLFVNWWPEDHFEYGWHLQAEQLEVLRCNGMELRRVTGYAWNEPWNWKFLVRRAQFVRELISQAARADLVVAHMDSFPARIAGLARVLGFIRRPKLVMVDYWLHPTAGRNWFRRHAKRLTIRHVYGAFDLVLFDTEPGEREFSEEAYLGPRTRTAFLPISLSTAKRQHLACERVRIKGVARSQQEPYYFAAGNSNRDYDTLFAAAALLPQVRFVVMTNRPLDHLVVPGNVTFAEWGPYEEYLEMMVNARALVIPMPASVEAAGLRTLFEAWAMEVPTVVAGCEGVRTYLTADEKECAAFVYDPGDARSLAATLSSIESDPSRCDTVVTRATESLDNDFSSDAYIEKLVPYLISTFEGEQ